MKVRGSTDADQNWNSQFLHVSCHSLLLLGRAEADPDHIWAGLLDHVRDILIRRNSTERW
jgi:hypothetical protein